MGRGSASAGRPAGGCHGRCPRTFNDDLNRVQAELGLELVSDDDGAALLAAHGDDFTHVAFGDFDFAPIRQAFGAFGLDLRPDALALAVFDHGAAPPGVSDRQFRMDYLADRLQRDRRLSTLAAPGERVPADHDPSAGPGAHRQSPDRSAGAGDGHGRRRRSGRAG